MAEEGKKSFHRNRRPRKATESTRESFGITKPPGCVSNNCSNQIRWLYCNLIPRYSQRGNGLLKFKILKVFVVKLQLVSLAPFETSLIMEANVIPFSLWLSSLAEY